MSVMIPNTPDLRALRKESRALSAAMRCIESGLLTPEAQALVRDVFECFWEPTLPADKIVQCAQGRILGVSQRIELFSPAIEPADTAIFETTGRAWMVWAARLGGERRRQVLGELRAIPAPRGDTSEGRAVHLMALHPWMLAVTALLNGNQEEARRQFRRASELGGQLGTESSPAIHWTYAASFLNEVN